MSKKMTVGIFLFEEVEVLDFAGPFEVFSVASEVHNFSLFDVFTFGKEQKPTLAVNGLSVNPDYDFDTVPKADLLIIPGGNGTRKLAEDAVVLNKFRQMYEESQLTMTVCSGARLAGVTGLLDDKPFCTHMGVYDHMKTLVPAARPQPQLRYVQSSEKLYTSGGISAGIDLSFFLLGKLCGEEVVRKTAQYMEYRQTEETANFV
ncbi:MAG: DJ-1/PfpI family protein [Bacteroidota bacterium]